MLQEKVKWQKQLIVWLKILYEPYVLAIRNYLLMMISKQKIQEEYFHVNKMV
jgi:hypothetical protein